MLYDRIFLRKITMCKYNVDVYFANFHFFHCSRLLVSSVVFSICSYPLLTIVFQNWYNGLFFAATFDTFRVYEKAWSKECIVSFVFLQIFIVVLSLLPDYISTIAAFLKTTVRISEYRNAQSINGSQAKRENCKE